MKIGRFKFVIALVMAAVLATVVHAQTPVPSMLVSDLGVRTVISGMTQPISLAFIGNNDFFLLEKSTGRVQRVVNGAAETVLDLSVNSASERGLLGIALHPDFPADPGVYLYWTCTATAPPAENPFFPTERECSDPPAAGPDTTNILAVPLLGNRVDRFVWNGSTLTFDRNLIKLRAFQHDAAPIPPNQGDSNQPPAGNHNAGVLRFGPDKKLYIIIGDNGRRGQLQNLPFGPTPPERDDQFGGPLPDSSHLTGVVLRLNDDGSPPRNNPFFRVGAIIGGEIGTNLQKVFAYGIRNSFGMAFDPFSGDLWTQENGDDSFDEINRVEPGMDGGWVQIIGPVSRIDQFKSIELSLPPSSLQQFRWPPANIAETVAEAISRLALIPGAHYSDPEFSWKFAVAPGGIGFLKGGALGPQYEGNLFVGAATPILAGGYLFRFQFAAGRRRIFVNDPKLEDRVADNSAKYDITESESLLIGRDFGVGTDVQTGPNGNLFVVSLSHGAVYEVYRTR